MLVQYSKHHKSTSIKTKNIQTKDLGISELYMTIFIKVKPKHRNLAQNGNLRRNF